MKINAKFLVGFCLFFWLLPPAFSKDLKTQYIENMLSGSLKNDERMISENKELLESLPKPEKGETQTARELNERALYFINSSEFEQAIPLLAKASELAPSDVEILNNYGYALMKQRNLDKAISVLVNTLAIKPDRANAWRNLADVIALKGDVNTATAGYLNSFRFSKNRQKTLQHFQNPSLMENDSNVHEAVAKTIQIANETFFSKNTNIPVPAKLEDNNFQQKLIELVGVAKKEFEKSEKSSHDGTADGLGDLAGAGCEYSASSVTVQIACMFGGELIKPVFSYLLADHEKFIKIREHILCTELLPSNLEASNLSGTIESIGVSGKSGYLHIALSKDVKLHLSGNYIDVLNDGYYSLIQMKTGDNVIISGNFIKNKNKDYCIATDNATDGGELNEPEYIFQPTKLVDTTRTIKDRDSFLQEKYQSLMSSQFRTVTEVVYPQQQSFLNSLSIYRNWYKQANDLEKELSASLRDNALCQNQEFSQSALNWYGVVSNVGNSYLTVDIGSISDSQNNVESRIKLEQNNGLSVNGLQVGDKVKFSGLLETDSKNCIHEDSATQSGGMDEPEFNFKFKSVERLSCSAKVDRGLIGAALTNNNNYVQIQNITPQSPAEKSGLLNGDIIVGFDNHAVNSTFQLVDIVSNSLPNTNVTIEVMRNGMTTTKNITVGSYLSQYKSTQGILPNSLSPPAMVNQLGAFSNLSTEERKKYGIPTGGVIVDRVNVRGNKIGLAVGDVLTSVSGRDISDIYSFKEVVNSVSCGDTLSFVGERVGLLSKKSYVMTVD